MVDFNRWIQTSNPYNLKKDCDFKTWSNMKIQLEEDENESINDRQVLAARGDTFQSRIFAVQGCIAGIETQDLIVDTSNAVSIVS